LSFSVRARRNRPPGHDLDGTAGRDRVRRRGSDTWFEGKAFS
jgi:hypothetical protein